MRKTLLGLCGFWLETRGNNGNANLVTHAFVDNLTVDDVGVFVSTLFHDLGSFVNFEQRQVFATSNRKQDARSTRNACFEQLGIDGSLGRFEGSRRPS